MRAAPGGSCASGLFGNIASTAAGVVAGSFLFQGIQGLMHHGDSHPLASAGNTAWPAETPLNDTQSSQWPPQTPLDTSQSEEPELLNSYFTDDSDTDNSLLSDSDDSGSDFV